MFNNFGALGMFQSRMGKKSEQAKIREISTCHYWKLNVGQDKNMNELMLFYWKNLKCDWLILFIVFNIYILKKYILYIKNNSIFIENI